MIILKLAAGGRVAVRPADVAAAQTSEWGATLLLASDRAAFEVEHSLQQLSDMLPSLWFHTPDTIFNPDLIASIWEEEGRLHYRIEGGLQMTQTGVDLHQFLDTLETGRRHRAETGLAGPRQS